LHYAFALIAIGAIFAAIGGSAPLLQQVLTSPHQSTALEHSNLREIGVVYAYANRARPRELTQTHAAFPVVLTDYAAPIDPAVLAALIETYAPDVDVRTQAAVIAVESGGNAWVLHDNNTDGCQSFPELQIAMPCRPGSRGSGAAYYPQTYEDALTFGRCLVAVNHVLYGSRDSGVDVGLAQINSTNFPGYGVTLDDMLRPGPNIALSGRMLSRAYTQRLWALGSARDAHWQATLQALQVYNSGHAYGDDAYVTRVLAAYNNPFALTIALVSGAGPSEENVAVANTSSPVVVAQARAGAPKTHVQRAQQPTSWFYHEPTVDKNAPPSKGSLFYYSDRTAALNSRVVQ